MTSPSRKEGRLYKVCIGKFSDRKKAESLCEKIKKTEGFQAFITLR
jgi:cell division septation protein DedD